MSRTLSPLELARVRAACRGGVSAQRRFAAEFDPHVFRAWDGWTWGRRAFELFPATIDAPPKTVHRWFKLHATEYVEAKHEGTKTRHATYRHEHDSPYAIVTTVPNGALQARAPM